jgi:hypothetical protein
MDLHEHEIPITRKTKHKTNLKLGNKIKCELELYKVLGFNFCIGFSLVNQQ